MSDNRDHLREHPRLALQLAVAYRTTGSFLVAYSVNLSKGGVFIEATPLPIGTPVELEVEVPGVGTRIAVEGTVAWARETASEGAPVGMGIRFTRGLDSSVGRLIDELAASFEGLEILVVAAAPDRRALLVRYLRSMVSCECLEAESWKKADVGLNDGVDLVLVDLDASGADGMTVIKRASALPSPPPMIALAGEQEVREWARTHGVEAVVGSPPVFAELQAAVISVLARPIVAGGG